MLKKITALIALLAIVVSALPFVGAASVEEPPAEVAFESVADLDLIICKEVNSSGEPVRFDSAVIERDASNILYLKYTVKAGFTLTPGVPYTFTINGSLTDFAGDFTISYGDDIAANGEVDNAGKVTLTFTDVANADALLLPGCEGVFYFEAKFVADEIANSGTQDIEVTAGGKEYAQTFYFEVDEVTASATPLKTNSISLADRRVTWSLKVTPSITNATANLSNTADTSGKSDCKFNSWTIRDVIEAEKTTGGLSYVDGSLALSPEVSGAVLNYNSETREITCVFPPDMPIDGTREYILSFTTEFTVAEISARLKAGEAEFKNKASSVFTFPTYEKSAEELTRGKAILGTPKTETAESNESSAKVSGGTINKQASFAGGNNQKWVLSITNSLGLAGAQLNDKLPKSVDIVTDADGNPAVYLGVSASGTKLPAYVEGASAAYPSYSYRPNSDGSHTLTIHLEAGTLTQQDFCYETQVSANPANYDGGPINNHVDFSWQGTGTPAVRQIVASKTASVTPGGYYMSKSGTYDPATHTVTWKVFVDQTGLSAVSFIDTVPAGQTYIAGSIQTIKPDASGLEDGSAKTTLGGSGSNVITVDFSSVADQVWSTELPAFEYKTLVNDNTLWALNTPSKNPPKAGNSVVIHATGLPDEGYKLSASTPIESTVLEKKSLGYDHVNKTIGWQLTVNKNEMTMTNPTIVDTLQPGWSFERASVNVTQSSATVAPVATVFSTDSDGNAVLRLDLPNMTQGTASAKPYIISYTTKLDDLSKLLDNEDWELLNTAKLTAAEMPSAGQTVTAAQDIDAPMLTKQLTNTSSAKNDGFLSWEVVINQGLTAITAARGSASLVLIDPLITNLALDLDSVHLRALSVDERGTLVDGAPLTCGSSYDFSYDSLAGEMRIDFKVKTITTAYKLTFNTDFVQLSNGVYSNSVYFEGLDAPTQTASSGNVDMNFSGGRASPRNSYGYLRVNTTDAGGTALPGAEITLIKSGAARGATAITDSGGVAKFYVPTGDYTLSETKAPPGYSMPAVRSWSVSVQTASTAEYTVINTKTPSSRSSQSGRANPDTGI